MDDRVGQGGVQRKGGRWLASAPQGLTRKLIGFEILDRGIARHGHPISIGGRQAGLVTSGTLTPYLKKAVGMAYVPVDASEVGTEFLVEVRGRQLGARVVKMPFYRARELRS